MTTSTDAGVSLNEMLQAAIEAEKMGVPIDWKQACFTATNVANNYIGAQEEKIKSLEAKVSENLIPGESLED